MDIKELQKDYDIVVKDDELFLRFTDLQVVGIDESTEKIVVKSTYDDKMRNEDIREICLHYNIVEVLSETDLESHNIWKNKLLISNEDEFVDLMLCAERFGLMVLKRKTFNDYLDCMGKTQEEYMGGIV